MSILVIEGRFLFEASFYDILVDTKHSINSYSKNIMLFFNFYVMFYDIDS